MNNIIASNQITLIVGLGLTGVSVARFLAREGRRFFVADESPHAERLGLFRQEFPDVQVLVGELDFEAWSGVSEIVLSPGVPRANRAIAKAIEQGVPVIGDVELFRRAAKAPLVAITGSNGKTTVTALVGAMAREAGCKVKVGGNIGIPCLDLLDETCELYVLELSSFQLESIGSLGASVASILNLSADHLDRYSSFQDYYQAKQKIYLGAKAIVANKDDALTQALLAQGVRQSSFGANKPDLKDYGLIHEDGSVFLAKGLQKLLNVEELKIKGKHNQLNALAALAIGEASGLQLDSMITTLKGFEGLPHRCQFVARVNDVEFYNDSKATNAGAAIAAVTGFAQPLILIAGGDAKGGDFSDFAMKLPSNLKMIITIGVDGPKIYQACAEHFHCLSADSLKEAVGLAAENSASGDAIILSPACASLDMFKNYQDRGQQFVEAVEALCTL